jgi:hypothetical protein
MDNFTKVLHPCNLKPEYTGRAMSVFVTVRFEDGRLSLTGVEGPTVSGNARGGCGQITIEPFSREVIPAKLWDRNQLAKLVAVWDKWHLNDIHAECEHQESVGLNWTNAPGNVCEICGYKLGHGWTRREVPEDVLTWLKELPSTDITPAWH